MTYGSWITHRSASPAASPVVSHYRQRLAEAMKMIEGQGGEERAELLDRYRAAAGAGSQDLMSRGLMGGGTILSSMRRGYRRDYDRALGGLNESLGRQRLDVFGQMSGDVGAAMQQQQQMDYQQQLAAERMALERNRMRTHQPRYGGLSGGGFQTVGGSRYPNAGSFGSLLGNRAYRRINA